MSLLTLLINWMHPCWIKVWIYLILPSSGGVRSLIRTLRASPPLHNSHRDMIYSRDILDDRSIFPSSVLHHHVLQASCVGVAVFTEVWCCLWEESGCYSLRVAEFKPTDDQACPLSERLALILQDWGNIKACCQKPQTVSGVVKSPQNSSKHPTFHVIVFSCIPVRQSIRCPRCPSHSGSRSRKRYKTSVRWRVWLLNTILCLFNMYAVSKKVDFLNVLKCYDSVWISKHWSNGMNKPDEGNIRSTNDVVWGRGYLLSQPMAESSVYCF